MTTTYELGYIPNPLPVNLVQDADFVTAIESGDGTDWPVSATIALLFSDGTVWPATINGVWLEWEVDKVDVNAVIGALVVSEDPWVRLTYLDGPSDLVWAEGIPKVFR